MKRLYIISILFILLSLPSQAQQLRFGVKGGLSLVNVVAIAVPDGIGSGTSNNKIRPSYHFGAYGVIDLSKKFYLQAELLYTNKGFKFDNPKGSNANLHLHYLTLPVLFNYRILEKLYVEAGGELGYRLAARSKSGSKNANVNFIYKRKLDMGVDAGVKYKINENLSIGIRYNHGLSNIFGERSKILDINQNYIGKGPKYQNRAIQFSIGYALLRR